MVNEVLNSITKIVDKGNKLEKFSIKFQNNEDFGTVVRLLYEREIANTIINNIYNSLPKENIIKVSFKFAHNYRIIKDNIGYITLQEEFKEATNNMTSSMCNSSGLVGLHKPSCYIANIDLIPLIMTCHNEFKETNKDKNFIGGAELIGYYNNVPVIQCFEPELPSYTMLAIFNSKKYEDIVNNTLYLGEHFLEKEQEYQIFGAYAENKIINNKLASILTIEGLPELF